MLLQLTALSAQAYQSEIPKNDALQLTKGNPIKRMLKTGEKHFYLIYLEAGQYVHIAQKGKEVFVFLYGPDGKKIAEIERPDAQISPDQIWLVAETSGNYRLEVFPSADRHEPPLLTPPEPYELKVVELRPSTPQDKIRVAAYRAFAEGWQLRRPHRAESRRKAIAKYEEALRLWQQLGNRAWEGKTLYYIGYVYTLLAENQKSLEYFHKARSLLRTEGDIYTEAGLLNDMGSAYNKLGEKQQALIHLKEGLKLRKIINDRWGIPHSLHAIGKVYAALGEMEKALNYFNRSLKHYRALTDRNGEGVVLGSIGGIYSSREEYKKALKCYKEAQESLRKTENRTDESREFSNIGWTYFLLGDDNLASDYLNQSLKMQREVGDRFGEAQTLNNIGKVNESSGNHQEALSYYREALQFRQSVSDPSGEALTLYSIARVMRELGNFDEARIKIEKVLTIIETLRSKIAVQEHRASYFATVREYYEFYIDLLMMLHRRDAAAGCSRLALETCERARARSFLELLSEARVNIRDGVDPKLIEQDQSLRRRLNGKWEQLVQIKSSRHTEEEIIAAEKEIENLIHDFQEIEAEIREKSPRFAELTQPQVLKLEDIQQLLDNDTVLLEFSLGSRRSYLWLITATAFYSYELPSRTEIETVARRIYELLNEHSRRLKGETAKKRHQRLSAAETEYNRAITRLSRMLIGEAFPQLTKKRLLIVADGILQYLPFSALPVPEAEPPEDASPDKTDNRALLALDYEIVGLPSASALAALRRRRVGREPAGKTIVTLADPVFTKDDERIRSRSYASSAKSSQEALIRSAKEAGITDFNLRIRRLPFTKEEALAIMALVPARECRVALDFEASKALAISGELSEYRYVHFATHGLLNSVHAELSGIVLSLVDQNGRTQDGFLQLFEIYNLKLSADLVVLSACQTGLGKDIKGEGLVGLTRGFMYAGAPCVMASLWKVEDLATAELMKHFYREVLGERQLGPAAALRAAHKAMLKTEHWRSPYYWAGFVLQGECR